MAEPGVAGAVVVVVVLWAKAAPANVRDAAAASRASLWVISSLSVEGPSLAGNNVTLAVGFRRRVDATFYRDAFRAPASVAKCIERPGRPALRSKPFIALMRWTRPPTMTIFPSCPCLASA